jgi:hypothetical protein
MNFWTKLILIVAIVCQKSYGKLYAVRFKINGRQMAPAIYNVVQTGQTQANNQSSADKSSKSSADSILVESVVPDEPEPEPEPEEPLPSRTMGETGGESQESQSLVEEYLKEHPEVHSFPNELNSEQKTKFAYNKFGDIISVPVTNTDPKQQEKEPQPQQSQQQTQQSFAGQYPGYPMPLMPQSGYPLMYGFPYYNQFGYNQVPPQSQLLPPSISQSQQPKAISTKPQKPFGIVRVGKIDPNLPEDVKKHFKQSESEDEQLAAVVQAAEQAKANKEARIEEPQVTQIDPMPSSSSAQTQKQFMLNPYQMPFAPPFEPMAYLPQNQFKIDRNNMQVIPMQLPGGGVVDPNTMQKLQSGVAQLDMANARIIPMPLVEKKKPKKRPTEAPTIEDFPEIPEVVIKKPIHKKQRKKITAHLVKSVAEEQKFGSDLVKKPTFILRARLSHLPQKNQKGKNQWWKRPVPNYCWDPIIEITNCRKKKLEKRWSYNPEDERCYLYEDYCAKAKKNTFKNINQCMTTCWRPK